MQSEPFVSVILPVFNAEQTLEKAIESILNQTYTHFECLLINDGSTDSSIQVMEKYAKRDKRIRLIHIPKSGIVGSLNTGITQSKGSLVARMDADDISKSERLYLQVEFLTKNDNLGFCGTKVRFLGDSRKSAGYKRYVNWTNSILTSEQINTGQFIESPFAHPSVMFRKELVNKFGGYRNGNFSEDYELWLRWLEHGVQAGKVDEVLLDWYDLPNRLSRSDSRYSKEAFYQVKAQYLACWLRKHNPHHPEVIIWGAGRPTRKRAAHLKKFGIRFQAYVDIHPGRIGKSIDEIPVLSPDDLSVFDKTFVISYVGNIGARELITGHLEKLGYKNGINFICAA